MTCDVPMILLSGMAADERLFARQREEFSELVVPGWIEPLVRESLSDYAARLAERVDPGRPCIVGGASFGGLVALEMAVRLQALACVLIASVRSPAEFPRRWRWLRPAAQLGPERLGRIATMAASASGPSMPAGAAHRLRRFCRPDATFLRWATCAALAWRPSPEVRRLRVFQIHGDRDTTFPIRHTRPDIVVAGGGHVLPVTHAERVNQFLRHVAETVGGPAPPRLA